MKTINNSIDSEEEHDNNFKPNQFSFWWETNYTVYVYTTEQQNSILKAYN